MGSQNRQRRKQKSHRRAEESRRRAARPHAGGPGPTGDRSSAARSTGSGDREVRRLVAALWTASGHATGRPVAEAIDLLRGADTDLVAAAGELTFPTVLAALWGNGWQPAELSRHARRVDPEIGRIVAAAIVSDHRQCGGPVHPRWAAQIDMMAPLDSVERGWLADVLRREGRRNGWLNMLVVRAMVTCLRLGPLATLIPPPGTDPSTWGTRDDDGAAAADDPVLAKVRALLAQAESTTFEAEADLFTAKAQELMARHAIDAALLWSRSQRKERPIAIRIPVDDPYADVKALLLTVVARHSQCRAIGHPDYGLESVIGFAGDIASAEILFTSLLVQSQMAMQAEAAAAPPGGRTRSRSFRSSFLLAYTHRISARLTEINDAVQQSVESQAGVADLGAISDLTPVLAARSDAVDDEVATLFGKLAEASVRGATDRLGWDRGKLAADRADLNPTLAATESSTSPAPPRSELAPRPAALF